MWRMTAATYFTGWWVVRTLPEAVAYKFFSGIADFVFRRNGKSVQRLRMNLSRTQPHLEPSALESLTQEAMRSYMR